MRLKIEPRVSLGPTTTWMVEATTLACCVPKTLAAGCAPKTAVPGAGAGAGGEDGALAGLGYTSGAAALALAGGLSWAACHKMRAALAAAA
jgi:hypothetical protein